MGCGGVLTVPLWGRTQDESVMKLIDVIIVSVVLAGTVGLVIARALVRLHEFRVQRRVARILERNASLLERESPSKRVRRP
jgi:hypothetical protein